MASWSLVFIPAGLGIILLGMTALGGPVLSVSFEANTTSTTMSTSQNVTEGPGFGQDNIASMTTPKAHLRGHLNQQTPDLELVARVLVATAAKTTVSITAQIASFPNELTSGTLPPLLLPTTTSTKTSFPKLHRKDPCVPQKSCS